MKIFRKRGNVETAWMVKLITIFTLGIVLFVIVKNAGQAHVNLASKNTCEESVQQYAKLNLAGHNLANTNVIKCPVQPVTINPNNEGRAKKELANLMFDCFDQFGAGELDIFATRRGSTDHYCVVCNKVSFTEPGKVIRGLPDYLSENFIPGTGKTYFQYFKGEETARGESATVTNAASCRQVCDKTICTQVCEQKSDAVKLSPFPIDSSVEQAILFTYSKSTGWWDKLVAAEIAGTAGVVAGGAVAGFFTGGLGWVAAGSAVAVGGTGVVIAMVKAPDLNSDWQAGVILLPYDQNANAWLKCDELPIKQ